MNEWREFFKTLPSLFILGFMVLLSIVGYREWTKAQESLTKKDREYKERVLGLEKQILELKNGMMSSSISEVDKKYILEQTDKSLRDILDQYGFEPVGSSHVSGKVSGVSKPINKNKRTYLEWPSDEEGNRIKLGYVDGDLYRIYGLKFDTDITIVKDKDGNKESIAAVTVSYADTASELSGDTTQYHIKVNKVTTNEVIDEPEIAWRLAPHIDGGVSAKINQDSQIGGGIGVSVFAYGETDDDNIIRAPRVGVAGNQDELWVELGAQYNLGKNIPVFSDLWITGSACYDSLGQPAICLGIDSTF